MSILLVGFGYWGENWARALARMGELAAICEQNPSKQRLLQEHYPHVKVYENLPEALSHPGIQAVVVATPAITHHALALQCLMSGKSVLVEKPLAMDPKEAHELTRLAEKRNLVLAVGHLLLYHPALVKLKALMNAGELGDILSVHCTRANLGKVRNEENVWWSLAPHDLSIISLLLEEPLTVSSVSAQNLLGRPHLEDSVYVTLASERGKHASVHVNWLSPAKRHETIVVGSRKIAIFEDTQPPETKLQLLDYELTMTEGFAQGPKRGNCQAVAYEQPPQDLLALQAMAFIEAVRERRFSLPNDGWNGWQVVQLLSDAQRMINRGSAKPDEQAIRLHTVLEEIGGSHASPGLGAKAVFYP